MLVILDKSMPMSMYVFFLKESVYYFSLLSLKSTTDPRAVGGRCASIAEVY